MEEFRALSRLQYQASKQDVLEKHQASPRQNIARSMKIQSCALLSNAGIILADGGSISYVSF